MRALHGGSTANLEIAPNLWAGVGLVRGGAGTALVGEGVLPELGRRGLWSPPVGHVAETGPVSVPFAGVSR